MPWPTSWESLCAAYGFPAGPAASYTGSGGNKGGWAPWYSSPAAPTLDPFFQAALLQQWSKGGGKGASGKGASGKGSAAKGKGFPGKGGVDAGQASPPPPRPGQAARQPATIEDWTLVGQTSPLKDSKGRVVFLYEQGWAGKRPALWECHRCGKQHCSLKRTACAACKTKRAAKALVDAEEHKATTSAASSLGATSCAKGGGKGAPSAKGQGPRAGAHVPPVFLAKKHFNTLVKAQIPAAREYAEEHGISPTWTMEAEEDPSQTAQSRIELATAMTCLQNSGRPGTGKMIEELQEQLDAMDKEPSAPPQSKTVGHKASLNQALAYHLRNTEEAETAHNKTVQGLQAQVLALQEQLQQTQEDNQRRVAADKCLEQQINSALKELGAEPDDAASTTASTFDFGEGDTRKMCAALSFVQEGVLAAPKFSGQDPALIKSLFAEAIQQVNYHVGLAALAKEKPVPEEGDAPADFDLAMSGEDLLDM